MSEPTAKNRIINSNNVIYEKTERFYASHEMEIAPADGKKETKKHLPPGQGLPYSIALSVTTTNY